MAHSQLDPTGKPVRVDRIAIRTPGLAGNVVTTPPTARAMRGAAGMTSEFDQALKRHGMQITDVASFDVSGQSTGRSRRSRGAGTVDKPAIILDVPAPAPGWEQVVVAVDEHGVITWHFGQGSERGGKRSRGVSAGSRRYVIPHHEPVGKRDGGTRRSLLGKIGKRVVKVIAFKVGRYVGRKARELMRDWENRNRPNGLRTFLPAERAKVVPYLDHDAPFWQTLGGGRGLLLVHGTFSRAHSGLGAFPEIALERLHNVYGGRVFAFDHHTISDSPADNVRWLLENLPAMGHELELDIVCHSRGGLVARTLAERGEELGATGRVRVRRIALVAVPSEGTILADVDNWNRLLDTMTSLVNLAGGPGFGDIIETLLAFVRQVAVAGYPALAGLAAMVPMGDYLADLNKRPRTGSYLGITSDFEPHTDDFVALVKDEALDLLHAAANDMLVRTDSALGSKRFRPVDKSIVLAGAGSVDHSAYFGQPEVMKELVDWLAA